MASGADVPGRDSKQRSAAPDAGNRRGRMNRSEGLPPNHRHRERGAGARDWAVDLDSTSQGNDAASDKPEFYAAAPPVAPQSYAATRWNYRVANAKPSAGKRMLRAVTRFCVAVLLGVGGTLAWQSYGDEATAIVRTQAPSLGWMLPAATAAPSAPAATLPQVAEQLKSVSLDLVVVRRALEQIAAKNDQLAAKQVEMAQTVATLQDIEQSVSQQLASVLSSPAAHAPPHKPPPQQPPASPPLATGQPQR